MRLRYLSEEDFARVRKKYERFFLKLPKEYRRSIFLQALSYDKKRAAGQMRFVLIDRIGHAIPFGEDYCTVVTPDELEPTLDWMERVFF
jgi:3-dehydroquinate synthetase